MGTLSSGPGPATLTHIKYLSKQLPVDFMPLPARDKEKTLPWGQGRGFRQSS
jgi:hypothetical protein